jgi:adhesin/invasin
LSSTGAGPKTVTAVAGGVTLNQQPIVTVTAGPAHAGQSTVSASPTSITQTTGTSTITVTVKDEFGNPVSGSTVVVEATGSGNSITGPGATTNASGVATATLSSTVAPETVRRQPTNAASTARQDRPRTVAYRLGVAFRRRRRADVLHAAAATICVTVNGGARQSAASV